MPIPDVVFASEAPPVAASLSGKPRRARERDGRVDEPPRPLELLHRPPRRHRLDVHRHVRHRGRRRSSRTAATAASRSSPGRRAGRPPGGLLGHDVRPGAAVDDPDVAGHARPAAVERVEGRDECAAARIALRPFSGSTPACAARPWIAIRTSTMPLRELTMSPLARAHSSTKAASASRGQPRMTGSTTASRSPRPGWRRRQPLERQPLRRPPAAAPRARTGRRAGRPSCP